MKERLLSSKFQLTIVLLMGFILRILISLDPIQSNDAIAYIQIAHDIMNGKSLNPLEHHSYGNRLIVVIYVLIEYATFGTAEYPIKIINMIPSLLTIIVTYKFTKDLIDDESISIYTATIAATLPIEVLYSGSGTLDPMFGFFTGLFFWLYYRSVHPKWSQKSKRYSFFAGLSAACLVSVRVLGFFVFIALGVYLIYNRIELKRRNSNHLSIILGFLAIYWLEFMFMAITTRNPFYGLLRRLGFDVGGQQGLDADFERLDASIYSQWTYPEMIFVPFWIGFFGYALLSSIIYFLYKHQNKEPELEISVWIIVMFIILQWFPLFFILDPVGIIESGKPWTFEKNKRFFTIFTITGLALVGSFVNHLLKFEIGIPHISKRKLLHLGFFGMIMFNLMINAILVQPINNQENIREVTDYLHDQHINQILVDHPELISKYEVASNFRLSVILINSTEQINRYQCSYLVVNSSIQWPSQFNIYDFSQLELVLSFYSKSVSVTSFYTFEFTTEIYYILPSNNETCMR